MGTQSYNYRVEAPTGSLFVKVFSSDADLAYERANLDVIERSGTAGIPVLLPLAGPAGRLAVSHGLAFAVWNWSAGTASGCIGETEAADIGAVLAKLHVHLGSRSSGGSWPAPSPHYRIRSVDEVRGRLQRLARHIHGLETRTPWDDANLWKISERVSNLVVVPSLLQSIGEDRNDVIHGDYVRPNLLTSLGRLVAVIDFRIRLGDARRELGRAVFDLTTIAKAKNWLAVVEAGLTGYLNNAGTLEPKDLVACPRLVLLHSLCSTLPLEEYYFNPNPYVTEFIRGYWDDECDAVRTLLEHQRPIDSLVSDLIARHSSATAQEQLLPTRKRAADASGRFDLR